MIALIDFLCLITVKALNGGHKWQPYDLLHMCGNAL